MGLINFLVGGIIEANKKVKQNHAQKDDTSQNVVVNGKYSIDVPSFLKPMKHISDDASLQYGNRVLDISYVVIDEPKTDFINSYNKLKEDFPNIFSGGDSIAGRMASVTINNMFDIDKIQIDDYCETRINGLNAVTLNVFQKRTFFKDAVYGSFAFIEGRDTLYQVIIMSGGTSILKLAEKLALSINSFKEL